MPEPGKIVLTYETLFDFLRREKGHEDLQKTEQTFYGDIEKYLYEKTNALTSAEKTAHIFAGDEQVKLQKQVENIKSLLKELYDRREKKIVALALLKSRTQSTTVDTSALLEEEKPLFMELSTTLSSQRDALLHRVLAQQHRSQQDQKMTISFLHYVPKFVGRDLEVYGPFEPENTITIPKELALVLIAKGRAKEITETKLA